MKTIEQLKTDLAAATKEKADADAALVVAEKQKAEAEKKRVDAEAGFITFVISGAGGLVSRCRIPIATVAEHGLFRILLGSGPEISNMIDKALDPNGNDVAALLRDVNTINTWAEPRNANGITPNTVIDSNDLTLGNNQQRMKYRGY